MLCVYPDRVHYTRSSRRRWGARKCNSRAHAHTRDRVQSNFGPFFTCPVQAADDVYVPCILYCVTVRSSRVYRRRRRRICQSRSHYIYTTIIHTYIYIIYYTCFILYIYYVHIHTYI